MVHMANKVKGTEKTVRASISFPQVVYQSLERLANEKKVSLAWVVREAAETYLIEQKEGKNGKNV